MDFITIGLTLTEKAGAFFSFCLFLFTILLISYFLYAFSAGYPQHWTKPLRGS